MEVILLKDFKSIGKKGEIKNVSDGYAMNFLIPKGIAVKKTPDSVAELDKHNAEEAARQADLKAKAKDAGIKGYSTMKKAEIIEALSK